MRLCTSCIIYWNMQTDIWLVEQTDTPSTPSLVQALEMSGAPGHQAHWLIYTLMMDHVMHNTTTRAAVSLLFRPPTQEPSHFTEQSLSYTCRSMAHWGKLGWYDAQIYRWDDSQITESLISIHLSTVWAIFVSGGGSSWSEIWAVISFSARNILAGSQWPESQSIILIIKSLYSSILDHLFRLQLRALKDLTIEVLALQLVQWKFN